MYCMLSKEHFNPPVLLTLVHIRSRRRFGWLKTMSDRGTTERPSDGLSSGVVFTFGNSNPAKIITSQLLNCWVDSIIFNLALFFTLDHDSYVAVWNQKIGGTRYKLSF